MKRGSGKYDRPIVIERMILEQDDFGQEIPTWVEFHRCYAHNAPLTGSERFGSDGKHAQAVTKLFLRYKSGIKTTMRVKLSCDYFRIVAVTEVGRREEIELYLERYE